MKFGFTLKIGLICTCLFVVMALLIGFWSYISTQGSVFGVVSPVVEERIDRTAQQLSFVAATDSTASYHSHEHFPLELTPRYEGLTDVHAQAYAIMERGSRELLYAKNLTQALPIASLTKIMTARTVLNGTDLEVELKVSSAAASIGEATMGLSAGELVRVEDLLYGLMLPSGNDAAEVLAGGLKGGRSDFMWEMNEYAKNLGLHDTFFFNPSGLDGETRETTNFSTALDLVALAHYSLQDPTFAKIAATYYKEIPYAEGKHKAFYLYNILQLSRSYPGVKGVKPGITDFAGETLVSYAENGGKQILIVLLGTQNSRDEVINMYDQVFAQLGIAVR